jgi:thiol-disulfide isomerase/thioredoxin
MEQLKKLVTENKVVVLDVYGPNCPDCVKFAPVFDRVAKEHKLDQVKFTKLEAAKTSQTRKELNDFLDPKEPSILRIPAVILFRDGKPLKLHFGPMSASELNAFIS